MLRRWQNNPRLYSTFGALFHLFLGLAKDGYLIFKIRLDNQVVNKTLSRNISL